MTSGTTVSSEALGASIDLATRLAGGVWGHLVGDAVGVPYEFRSAASIAADGPIHFGATGTHAQPPGTWSDDGGLMLALLDSLLAVGFDVEDQGRRAVAWWHEGAYMADGGVRPFDIGTTTRAALDAIVAGAPAASAGPTGELDCGNGSLMRILPIALVAAASGPRGVDSATDAIEPIASVETTSLVEQATAASRVTHGHPRAQVACALYTLAAVRLLAGERDRDRALERSRITLSRADHVGALDHLMAWPTRNGRSRVWDSFWSAWDAFAGAGSYRETIERAIAYGNDTDTTAAIAGGLAGIYWGIDGIPLEWLDGMRGDAVADPLVDRLLARQGWRTSTTNPLRVDWVDLANVPGLRGAAAAGGRLGMTFLPGKQRDGWTGMHWRDLRSDAARLGDSLGADTLLLLVEDHELEQARVPDIAAAMAEAGIDLIRFPIADMDVTSDRDGLRRVLDGILGRMAGGRSVLVACRGGLGRTGTIVGCLLRDGGLDAPGAIALTRASRKDTIERGTQIDFIHAWDWPPREALA